MGDAKMIDKVSPKGREREKGKKSVRSTRRLLAHVVVPIGDGSDGNMWTEVYLEVKHGFTEKADESPLLQGRASDEARSALSDVRQGDLFLCEQALEALVPPDAFPKEEGEACGVLQKVDIDDVR